MNNVYFLKIDAKGHSTIVYQNDADKADIAFDSFEEMVYESVNKIHQILDDYDLFYQE